MQDNKKCFEDFINERKAKLEKLKKRNKESKDINEVRSIGAEIDEIKDQIRNAQLMLDGINSNPQPDNNTRDNFDYIASVGGNAGKPKNKRDLSDPYDTDEYRSAFMEYACRGTKIPAELMNAEGRASAVTTTSDTSAVIPTTILNEIIKALESRGSIYSKLRKLNIPGGLEVPILDLKPTAKWIGETGGAESDKLTANTKVSFSYYGLECKISQTLLVNVVTFAAFQQLFVPLAVEAVIRAIEIGTFKGTGSGQMLGVLNDPRIPAKQVITMSEDDFTQWDKWKKKVFAKMKKSYRDGEFFMACGTFDGYIDGMVDKNGQPIGRVNYGIADGPQERFGGKTVELVEDDVLMPYEEAKAGDVVAVFMKLNDYAINTNMEMRTDKWEDHDTHEIKNNCLMILDGKMLDTNGVLIIKKGAASSPTE